MGRNLRLIEHTLQTLPFDFPLIFKTIHNFDEEEQNDKSHPNRPKFHTRRDETYRIFIPPVKQLKIISTRSSQNLRIIIEYNPRNYFIKLFEPTQKLATWDFSHFQVVSNFCFQSFLLVFFFRLFSPIFFSVLIQTSQQISANTMWCWFVSLSACIRVCIKFKIWRRGRLHSDLPESVNKADIFHRFLGLIAFCSYWLPFCSVLKLNPSLFFGAVIFGGGAPGVRADTNSTKPTYSIISHLSFIFKSLIRQAERGESKNNTLSKY